MFKRLIASLVCITFIFSNFQYVHAQDFSISQLPVPGRMISVTPAYVPLTLKGMVIYPENALKFDFLMDTGYSNLNGNDLSDEALKIMKYFLTALTIPEDDLWVNLSPYEKGRIVQNNFGQTIMGRDLLAEDYVLKQLTASVIYPENTLGKQFWSEIYSKASQQLGTTQIPVNTFNKVWIVPDKAVVWEHEGKVIIVKSHLKVMLEADYLSASKHQNPGLNNSKQVSAADAMARDTVRKLVIPVLEKEVNTGKNFAQLRQMFQAMILATWYKKALRESILTKVYADQKKTKGVDGINAGDVESIYQQYLKAFKKGAFNYIKEDLDSTTGQSVPRKYFSGGFSLRNGLVTLATALLVWGATLTNVQAMDVNHALKSTGTTILVKGNITDVGPGASADAVNQFEQTPQPQQTQDAAMLGLSWILLRYKNKQLESKLVEFLAKKNYDTLVKLLGHENQIVRQKTVEVLGNLGDKRAIDPLLEMLKDESTYLTAEASLTRLGANKEQMVNGYITVLSSEGISGRGIFPPNNFRNAIKKLGELGDSRAVMPLIGMLNYGLKEVQKSSDLGPVADSRAEIRKFAAIALGQLRDKRAIQPLLKVLKDYDNIVRSSAEAVLGELGASKEELVDGYIAALSPGWSSACNNAVIKLGNLGDERAIQPLLIGIVNDNEYEHSLREAALTKLGASKEQWVDSYIAALSSSHKGTVGSNKAIVNLGNLGDKRAIQPLLEMLNNKYDFLSADEALAKLGASKEQMFNGYIAALSKGNAQHYVIIKLGELGDRRAIQPLLGILEDEYSLIRLEALAKLGASKEQMFNAYIAALSSKNKDARIYAIGNIVNLGDNRSIGPLVLQLNETEKNSEYDLYNHFSDALNKLGHPAGDEIYVDRGHNEEVYRTYNYSSDTTIGVTEDEWVSDWRKEKRDQAMLGKMKIVAWKLTGNMDKIQTMLTDGNWDVRSYAGEAIVKLVTDKQKKFSIFVKNLGNKNSDVRRWAVDGLGQLGDIRAVELLFGMLKDTDKYVRSSTATALGLLDDKRAVEPLLGILIDRHEDEEVQRSTIESLGKLGDRRAIEPLLRLLEKSWHQNSSISGHSYVEEVLTTFAKSGASKEQIVNSYTALLRNVGDNFAARLAQSVIEIGGFEHEDVLKKLLKRRPSSYINTEKFLNTAIGYKKQGYDFKIVYESEETHKEVVNDSGGGSGYETTIVDRPEVLEIERGDKLDKAMLQTHKVVATKNLQDLGGIALDAAMLDLQIKRDGNGVPLPISQQPLDKINIQGFVPQIISIQPIDLPALLGFNFQKEEALAKA